MFSTMAMFLSNVLEKKLYRIEVYRILGTKSKKDVLGVYKIWLFRNL